MLTRYVLSFFCFFFLKKPKTKNQKTKKNPDLFPDFSTCTCKLQIKQTQARAGLSNAANANFVVGIFDVEWCAYGTRSCEKEIKLKKRKNEKDRSRLWLTKDQNKTRCIIGVRVRRNQTAHLRFLDPCPPCFFFLGETHVHCCVSHPAFVFEKCRPPLDRHVAHPPCRTPRSHAERVPPYSICYYYYYYFLLYFFSFSAALGSHAGLPSYLTRVTSGLQSKYAVMVALAVYLVISRKPTDPQKATHTHTPKSVIHTTLEHARYRADEVQRTV